MAIYLNEFDPKAAAWLRELMKGGHIPDGYVDERSITDVDPTELAGFTQLHFFAGVGGWPIAARHAGWPDDRGLVTGSCPCQPFSVAGKGAGTADARHLWPDFFRIIRAFRPACIMGEQVAAAVGKGWFLGVRTDLESIGYDARGIVVPACAVNAPHRRDRLWFAAGSRTVGDAGGVGSSPRVSGSQSRDERLAGVPVNPNGPGGGVLEYLQSLGRREGRPESELRGGRTAIASAGVSDCDLGDLPGERGNGRQGAAESSGRAGAQAGSSCRDVAARDSHRCATGNRNGSTTGHRDTAAAAHWAGAKWLVSHDGKARRVEPSIPLLVDGLPARAPLLRGYGNAIVPAIAAEMMSAWMEEFPA
ncbi:MAG: DNA cytosine methyltransferase [Comamonadaceae bacterium]|nr:MAG: DNA cytosine methyltransferase [Comamonadaceae bacterium]